jgi:hypothetical protein
VEWVFPAIVLAAVLCSLVGQWIRARRRLTAEEVAAQAGLQFSFEDPFDCTRVAFELFRRGDGRGAENVMWRDGDDGSQVRAFDYWYYVEHRDRYGRVSKSYEYFTCATTLVGGSWPPLAIHREGLLDKMADAVTGSDIDFESEQFNRTFTVTCEDRRFATTMIDARMMELLLSTRGELAYELRGRWLLVYAKRVPVTLMPAMLGVCDEFVERIPKVVWDLYPSAFVDKDNKPLPTGEELLLMNDLLTVDDEHHDHDPHEVLSHSPYDALHVDGRPEYDLDGHVVVSKPENPWNDTPPQPPA